MKKLIYSFVFYLICSNVFAAQAIYPFTNPKEETRFHQLTQEIRCVVCQNQNIADSNAPLANDLREKVYRMVLANESNDAIKTYLTERYGDFILLRPRLKATTALLWIFPVVMFALFIGIGWLKRPKTKC